MRLRVAPFRADKFTLSVAFFLQSLVCSTKTLRAYGFDRLERSLSLVLSKIKDQLKKNYHAPKIKGMDLDSFQTFEEKIKQAERTRSDLLFA
jgi:hypothetical protein